ncbi:MAG: nuclear transport factor 2 family protein [Phreatobacter sp.]|uniref:nuclear transport factor 2 family protein n=1 Tax=Phreatobacter sp. TaxID=1966341 RepID=UPI001A5375C5|nr:nuclear transport factor 2 family protein [Phreatobacter sp.]MBL8568794.1 nuclear transport factor 2 family protein [Phreatobacter sp.]
MSQAAVREAPRALTHDRSTVEAVINLYLDGLYESDVDKLAAAFHPTADLRWQEKGEFHVLTRADWLERVSKRPSARSQGQQRHDFVMTVDRSDESTVFVKVKCALPPRFFTDYLVLLKLTDGWQVVSKAYRYEMRE